MKKLISLLFLSLIVFAVNAQTLTKKTITRSNVYPYAVGNYIVLLKDSSVNQPVYVTNFCDYSRFQVTQAADSGYAKTKTYLEYSFDNALWVKMDSVSVAGNGKGYSSYKTPYAPYMRLRTVALDSTQYTRVYYYWLINVKN